MCRSFRLVKLRTLRAFTEGAVFYFQLLSHSRAASRGESVATSGSIGVSLNISPVRA